MSLLLKVVVTLIAILGGAFLFVKWGIPALLIAIFGCIFLSVAYLLGKKLFALTFPQYVYKRKLMKASAIISAKFSFSNATDFVKAIMPLLEFESAGHYIFQCLLQAGFDTNQASLLLRQAMKAVIFQSKPKLDQQALKEFPALFRLLKKNADQYQLETHLISKGIDASVARELGENLCDGSHTNNLFSDNLTIEQSTDRQRIALSALLDILKDLQKVHCPSETLFIIVVYYTGASIQAAERFCYTFNQSALREMIRTSKPPLSKSILKEAAAILNLLKKQCDDMIVDHLVSEEVEHSVAVRFSDSLREIMKKRSTLFPKKLLDEQCTLEEQMAISALKEILREHYKSDAGNDVWVLTVIYYSGASIQEAEFFCQKVGLEESRQLQRNTRRSGFHSKYILYTGIALMTFIVLRTAKGAMIQSIGGLFAFIILVLFYFYILPNVSRKGYEAKEISARMDAPDGKQALLTDFRPYFLYLRSFLDDGDREQHGFFHNNVFGAMSQLDETYEQELVSQLNFLGPVIGFGNPQTRELPPLGAARIYYPYDSWVQNVCEMITHCGVVVFRLQHFDSEGIRIELEKTLRLKRPLKALIIIPTELKSPSRETIYAQIRDQIKKHLGISIPHSLGTAVVLCLRSTNEINLFDGAAVILNREYMAIHESLLWLMHRNT